MLSKSALRSEPPAGVRRAYGIPLAGPAMVQPAQFAGLRKARLVELMAARAAGVRSGPARTGGPAVRSPRSTASAAPGLTLTPSGTGINPWWRYQEEAMPGGDRLMINVGTGNLLVQSEDLDVPHKGVALAFRRTYNSQSEHDVYGTDGAQAGMYGNGWTNTLDAHIVAAPNGTASVYDIDGARYDYVPGAGGYAPPPGQHASLVFDGACGLLWTKKSGTVYQFYRPTMSGAGCASPDGGYAGRLYRIVGRNHNTMVTLAYSWDGGFAGAGGKISQITAATESGLSTALTFADFNGYRLLQSLTRPDGVRITYGYGGYLNLRTAALPPNSAAGTPVVKAYGYGSWPGGNPAGVMNFIASPRWSGSNGADGEYLQIGSAFAGLDNAHSSLSEIDRIGFVDPTPSDGTNTPLQPAPASGSGNAGAPFSAEYFALGTLGSPSTPTFRDSDGHYTNWVTEASGRPMQTQECTATQNQQCTGTLLISGEQWDAGNNLASEVDARGYQTDYAYDQNGNTTEVALAPTTVTTGVSVRETMRPTKRYSYDGFNNVVAFCDESWSHANGADWDRTGRPPASDSLCPNQPGTTQLSYDLSDPAEPFGRLTALTTPLGNHRFFSYATGPQGGDFGLVSEATSDADTNNDGTPRADDVTLQYDASGNITVYSAGNGSWSLAYDAMNRLLRATDPDGYTSYSSYNADGSLDSKETPYQHATSSGVTYQYDLDGNAVYETHHFGSINPSPTQKWYDGAGRLVEVQQPRDPSDFYAFPWRTRYLYDLTTGGQVTIAGQPHRAYGNLFKTQEYLGSPTPTWSEAGSTGNAPQGFQDIAGTATDALDRATAQYRGATGVFLTYDLANPYTPTSAPNSNNFPSSTCNGAGECTYLVFDERGLQSETAFSTANAPVKTFEFDPRGQMVTASSANGRVTIVYDSDGQVSNRTQTTSASSSASTIAYHYYRDGKRKSLDILSSSILTSAIAYSYRPDGKLTTLSAPSSNVFSFSYSNAGRLTSRTDPGGATTTWSRDGYGRVTSLSTPVGGETSIQYDPEGESTSATPTYVAAGQWNYSTLLTTSYSTRGELVNEPYVRNGTLMANGVRIVPSKTAAAYSSSPTGSFTFSAIDGSPLDSQSGMSATGSTTELQYTYDKAGRQSSVDSTTTTYAGDSGSVGSESKDYDAEDHLLHNWYSNFNFAGAKAASTFGLGYVWGPTGHPFQIGSTGSGSSTFQYDSLFWDDETMLFSLNPAGAIDDIKIGTIADYIPAAPYQLTVWDRDPQGQIIGCHNGSGLGAMHPSAFQKGALSCSSISQSNTSFWSPSIAPASLVGQGGLLLAQKSDGLTDGANTIQGVRTFDTQAGVWNTPDVYRGNVHDPMSQKAYTWNRNNPYTYSDPSGYAPWWEEAVAAFWRLAKRESPFISSIERLEKGVFTSSGSLTQFGARLFRTLTSMGRMRGNYGIGSVGDVHQANKLGEMWVGPRYRAMSDGKGFVSRDGTKTFRFAEQKRDGTMQANFQKLDADGKELSNGHLSIRGDGINIGTEYFDESADTATGGDFQHLPPGRPL